MVFPAWQAILINFAGICIEVTATYFLGKFLGGESVEKLIKKQKNGEKLLNFKRKGKYTFVFLLRLFPLPLDFGSLFLGASDFPFPAYFAMSLLGLMPRVAVFTVLGYGIYNLIPMKMIIIAVLCAIPAVLIAWLVTKTVRQRSVPK